VKFIVDAQLPRRLARELTALGADALHTLELPTANRTPDGELRRGAVAENRIVVTKDGDFVDWFLLHGAPPKLFFISTGNITNDELLTLVRGNWPTIAQMLAQGEFVEMSRTAVILHA
jgi:predicted nuclease of predicted toxin-antitoxin system